MDFAELFDPGHDIRELGDGIFSALEPDSGPASRTDRFAGLYDAIIGNPIYNRAVWGASSREYTDFATAAVGSGDGPLLDAGCGTAVFTAAAYRRTGRPLVLVDRSLAMLRRAAARIGTRHAVFLQADLFALDRAGLRPHVFETIACYGVLHLLSDPADALRRLSGQLAPRGSLYATSLVAETARARRMLAALHRSGEAATAPRTTTELIEQIRPAVRDLQVATRGAMAFLTARAAT
ncbi:class I SAM-dependent methyltransferase [Nocardia transvalensis]|uniref:class I SAM-dependent methyltransferase n=1 Tax=Nocardia transvalensis TaxID=37333 RepID=UPI0018940CBA|nr:class I SAM-dependent methyltransferase [Nocardia transvalensis]MBF6328245.1 class I SAM-dependent methyltransferase [Nocardia transvalensis]